MAGGGDTVQLCDFNRQQREAVEPMSTIADSRPLVRVGSANEGGPPRNFFVLFPVLELLYAFLVRIRMVATA